jgi:hypothetical protein
VDAIDGEIWYNRGPIRAGASRYLQGSATLEEVLLIKHKAQRED